MCYHTLLYLLVIFTFGYSEPILGGRDVGKVVQERPAIITGQEKFSFIASLVITKKQVKEGRSREEVTSKCGGVIISEEVVLSAAHCFINSLSKPIVYVKYGFVHKKYEYYSARGTWADKFLIHENFRELYMIKEKIYFYLNDIAVVFLETPLTFSQFNPNVRKIDPIQFESVPVGMKGLILGWGLDETGFESQMLKQAESRVISHKECQIDTGNTVVMPNVFCIFSYNVAACPGDSGGPFFSNGMLYGIISFGFPEEGEGGRRCDPGKPQIITHVGMHKDWIKRKLRPRSTQQCNRRYDDEVNEAPLPKRPRTTFN